MVLRSAAWDLENLIEMQIIGTPGRPTEAESSAEIQQFVR